MELLKRLESFENGNGSDGRKVVNWVDRGRKAATRPSETVGLNRFNISLLVLPQGAQEEGELRGALQAGYQDDH